MIDLKKNNFSFNQEIDQYLTNIVKNKSYANGYIFYGAEGLGKKETSLRFIKEIFKQSSHDGSIDKCITNKNHPDLLIIEPSSLLETKKSKIAALETTEKSGSKIIKIDQIRNIKTFLGQKSISSERKIVLIVDAQLLNEAASNCLLKTLEEPNNGIFILLTPKLNSLLDTITSRCQLVRFRSLSGKEISSILKNYLDSSKLKIDNKFQFQDLVNSANGSPGQLLKNIEIWNELSKEITSKLDSPIKNYIEILDFSKLISEELDINQQVFLANLIQIIWWRKRKNISLVKNIENLKNRLRKNVQPRLGWEITLLKISMEQNET